MSPEEMIKSDDIEIAQLNVNILLQQGMNIIHIEELLKKTQYEIELFDRNYIILKQNWMYESMKMMEEFRKKRRTSINVGKFTSKIWKEIKLKNS
jgi:hypothetical protein